MNSGGYLKGGAINRLLKHGLRLLRAKTTQGVLGVALIVAVLQLYRISAFHLHAEEQFTAPLYFKFRSLIGRAPVASKKLKMIVYDDSSFALTGRPELSLSEWMKVLKIIDSRHPSAVYIDKLFSLPRELTSDEQASIDDLSALRTKPISIAFARKTPVPGRDELIPIMDQPRYQMQRLFSDAKSKRDHPWLFDQMNFLPFAYGPDSRLKLVFNRVGHAMTSGQDRISAFVSLSGDRVIPHVSLIGESTLTLKDKNIVLESGDLIPLDQQGRIYVNFLTSQGLRQSMFAMREFLAQDADTKAAQVISPGDYVLIAPAFFTGNTDFATTPVGLVPGPYVIASMLNSMITKQWIKFPGHLDSLLLLIAGMLAFLLLKLLGKGRPLAFIVLLASIVLLSCLAFAYIRFLIDLTPMILVVFLSAATALYFDADIRANLSFIIRALSVQKKVLELEISRAADIAQVFTLHELPKWSNFGVAVHYKPMSSVSGDWYAFETCKKTGIKHVIMCDIVGHGLQAGLIVSTCRTVLQIMRLSTPDAFEDLAFGIRYANLLNATLFANSGGLHISSLATISMTDSGEVAAVTCGHPPAVTLQMKEGKVVRGQILFTPNNPVGCDLKLNPIATRHSLSPGERIILVSDGIQLVKRQSKLSEICRPVWKGPLNDFVRRLVTEGRQAPHHKTSTDDETLIVVEYRPQKPVEIPPPPPVARAIG